MIELDLGIDNETAESFVNSNIKRFAFVYDVSPASLEDLYKLMDEYHRRRATETRRRVASLFLEDNFNMRHG